MARLPHHIVSCRAYRGGAVANGRQAIPEEVPVAFTYDGGTFAVMMASPADLVDFAIGFSLSQGLVRGLDEIRDIQIEDAGRGVDLRIWLDRPAGVALQARRHHLAGPVGCGLCGVDSIAEALRLPARVDTGLHFDPADIAKAVGLIGQCLPMRSITGAVHAAGFYVPSEGMLAIREDIGRHNALDKLVGALARYRVDGETGAVVVTSRVSVDIVQKTAVLGAPVLIALSRPTALAVRMAETAGITIAAQIRDGDFDVFTRQDRIGTEDIPNVA